jgi:wyosine [tRNA(Phe)-imidazoG37] synthetase (radical SAM superfamily)
MADEASRLVFGPIPSRRLGCSLGINHIPPKACSYSCVYCQVGPTPVTEVDPRPFYAPDLIVRQVTRRLRQLRERGETVDYLSFVPDGEPTLDSRLGEMIDGLKSLGIPIAVFTNASLIDRQEVRATLAKADWVSLKVDAVADALWRQVNQPHASVDHGAMLDGMLAFRAGYRGILCTETMLVAGVNDTDTVAEALAPFLARLAPDRAYLALPVRPPAEQDVEIPDEATLNRFFQILQPHVPSLEILTGYEVGAFGATGDLESDLLGVLAVHPMREASVRELVARDGGGWETVATLLASGRLLTSEYQGQRFYMRPIKAPAQPPSGSGSQDPI